MTGAAAPDLPLPGPAREPGRDQRHTKPRRTLSGAHSRWSLFGQTSVALLMGVRMP